MSRISCFIGSSLQNQKWCLHSIQKKHGGVFYKARFILPERTACNELFGLPDIDAATICPHLSVPRDRITYAGTVHGGLESGCLDDQGEDSVAPQTMAEHTDSFTIRKTQFDDFVYAGQDCLLDVGHYGATFLWHVRQQHHIAARSE